MIRCLLLLAMTALALPRPGFAAEAPTPPTEKMSNTVQATLVLPSPTPSASPAGLIRGLTFSKTLVPVDVMNQGSPDEEWVATLSGTFEREYWNLVADAKNLKGSFELRIRLVSQETPVRLVAVGPYGTEEEETAVISCPSYVSASKGSDELPSVGDSWNAGLGLTVIQYTQTGLPELSETALTPKFSYQHPMSSDWDVGGNVFGTALSLSSNRPGVAAYFFGANVRVGYVLPFVPSPWTLSLAVGGYFATMTSSGSDFGFRNVVGPQLFPVLRRSFGADYMAGAYFKYSPVTQSGSPFNFHSHELAAGLSLTRLLPNRHAVSATLDFSRIVVQVAPNTAANSSTTLGATYGF